MPAVIAERHGLRIDRAGVERGDLRAAGAERGKLAGIVGVARLHQTAHHRVAHIAGIVGQHPRQGRMDLSRQRIEGLARASFGLVQHGEEKGIVGGEPVERMRHAALVEGHGHVAEADRAVGTDAAAQDQHHVVAGAAVIFGARLVVAVLGQHARSQSLER